ncbi:MAG: hypothetical protein DRP01_00740 [Archaeoglobales archaeon]|nr:MAG: hypothetical protein DRP01_00740 [Archaeoglobales archaeon]
MIRSALIGFITGIGSVVLFWLFAMVEMHEIFPFLIVSAVSFLGGTLSAKWYFTKQIEKLRKTIIPKTRFRYVTDDIDDAALRRVGVE